MDSALAVALHVAPSESSQQGEAGDDYLESEKPSMQNRYICCSIFIDVTRKFIIYSNNYLIYVGANRS